jgi:hypothetical protein
MRMLEIRKPWMHGPDVRHLQQLLLRAGVRPGPADGQFGPRTAAACHLFKWRIGYAAGDCHPVAGGLVLAYLERKREPSVRMKLRAIARRRAEKAEHDERSARAKMRLRALAIIKGEIGTREQGANVIKYTKWWGWGAVAYCVIGIAWSWVRAGSKAFKRGARWANTDVMLADAKAGRNGLHLLDEPLPGSPGVIDFDGHSDPDHGITCIRVEGDEVVTGEFNTTRDGTLVEGVWEKRRALRNTWWFAVEY